MKRMTIRIPENIFNGLEAVRERRSHMSMNALIVEALERGVEEDRRIRSGSTQIDPEAFGKN